MARKKSEKKGIRGVKVTKKRLEKGQDEGAHSLVDQVIACPILRTSATTKTAGSE